MRTTPRVILILKQASSAARLHKTLAQKMAMTVASEMNRSRSRERTYVVVSPTAVFFPEKNNLLVIARFVSPNNQLFLFIRLRQF